MNNRDIIKHTYILLYIALFIATSFILFHILQLLGVVHLNKQANITVHLHPNNNSANRPIQMIDFKKENGLFAGHSVHSTSTEIHTREKFTALLPQIIEHNFTEIEKSKHLGKYAIDVSHWQGKIDWPTVLQDSIGIAYVFIKATQGAKEVDPYFLYNLKCLENKQVKLGFYHFFSFKDDPVAQARSYIKNIKLIKGNVKPIIDVELDCSNCKSLNIPKTEVVKRVKSFITEVEQALQTEVIIYTFEFFYNYYLKDEFTDHYFWMAKYASQAPFNYLKDSSLNVNPNIVMWQFSCSEKILGITGQVDCSFIQENDLDKITY